MVFERMSIEGFSARGKVADIRNPGLSLLNQSCHHSSRARLRNTIGERLANPWGFSGMAPQPVERVVLIKRVSICAC